MLIKFPHRHLLMLFSLVFFTGCASMPQDPESEKELTAEQSLAAVSKYLAEGDSEAKRGDLDAALLKYLLALDVDNSHVTALFKVSTVHRLNGNYGEARLGFQRAIAIDGDHIPSREGLALLELRSENLPIAEIMFVSIVEAEPNRIESLNALGLINDLQEQYAEAQEYYQRALALNPNSAKLANNLGYSYYLQGDLDAAEKAFSDLVNVNSGYTRAWSNLALIHAKKGNYELSAKAFDRIGTPHQTMNNLGYLQLLMGEDKAARKSLRKATDVAPKYYAIAQQNLESVGLSNSERILKDKAAISSTAKNNKLSALAVQESNLSTANSNVVITNISNINVPLSDNAGVEDTAINSAPKASFKTTSRKRKKPISYETVLKVQKNLLKFGYDPGDVDGVVGNKTVAALREFQTANGLEVTGKIDETVIEYMSF